MHGKQAAAAGRFALGGKAAPHDSLKIRHMTPGKPDWTGRGCSMGKLRYLMERVRRMDNAAMLRAARRISKQTGKALPSVLYDMTYCGVKYLAGYVDYETFRFYEMTPAQRETVITRGINNRYSRAMNNPAYVKLLDDKAVFNRLYNKQLGRRWADLREMTEEAFLRFFREVPDAVAKPLEESCGRGVERIQYEDDASAAALYRRLRENRQYLVEERIRQHDGMAALYPDAVNTLRFVTLRKNGKTHIVFVCLRIGSGGNVVDNFNHGGLFTTVPETGIVELPAVNKAGTVYETHPDTGTPIVGFQVPLFAEACRYVEALAGVIPEIGYAGWDIAVTARGPVVVEGNPFPGHDLYQSPIHRQAGGTGLRQRFEAIIYG